MTRDIDQITSRQVLKRWSKPARNGNYAVVGWSVLGTFAWVALAWAIAILVSRAADGTAAPTALMVGIGAVGIRAIALWRAERAGDSAGRRIVEEARRDILSALASRGAGMLAGESAAVRAAHIFDRTRKLEGYAARWLPGMMLAIISPVIILIATATQSWLSAVLLSVSVLVLPVFIWLTASGTASTARAQQASLDELSSVFQHRAAQPGLIRAFRAVNREEAVIAEAAETLRQKTMAILRMAFLSTAVLEFFASVSIALVAVYIGFKLLGVFPFGTGETITLKEGLMTLVLAPEFFAPIRKLSSLHHDRADGVAAAKEIGPWLANAETPPVTRWKPLAEAPLIRFDHVSLERAGQKVLNGLSFEAHPDQLTVIAGPSGSGKTSALLALLGQGEVSSGIIYTGQRPLLSAESLADSAAYLRQTPWITEASIADNLRLAKPDASDGELKDALRRADALDFIEAGQGGLDRRLARFGAGLSGGQRQRLALARALLKNAPILLLDEPTAHLDEEAETRFLTLLDTLKKDRTVLIASHRPAVLNIADTRIDLGLSEVAA